jgi:hypothetical protein
MALPEYLETNSETLFGDYLSFVEKFYPNGKLTTNLSKSERKLLLEVIKHSFYQSVVNDLKDPVINGQEEEAEQEEMESPELVEAVEEEIQAIQGTKSFVNRKSLLILNNKRPSTISTSSSSTTTEELLYGDIYNEQMKVSDVEPQEF